MADTSEPGKAELAHRGTLFVDEIHALQPKSQVEFLEFGNPGSLGRPIRRLGNFPTRPRERVNDAARSIIGRGDRSQSTHTIFVDVLLLAATNESLDDEEFRAKIGFSFPLYRRLARDYLDAPLHFPGLAARREDIPELFQHFVDRETALLGRATPKPVDRDAIAFLREQEWPGNVAELAGVARVAATKALDLDEVLVRHLPMRAARSDGALSPARRADGAAACTADDDGPPDDAAEHSSFTLSAALAAVRNARLPSAPTDLRGSLRDTLDVLGGLIERLLEAGLEATRENLHEPGTAEKRKRDELLGDLVHTSALRLLLQEPLTATQSMDRFRALARTFKLKPHAGSPLERVLRSASRRGRTTSSRPSST